MIKANDLLKFCGPTPHNKWLESPFFFPDHPGAYASDGRIMIWSEDRLGIENNLVELVTAGKFTTLKEKFQSLQKLITETECQDEVYAVTKPPGLNDQWRLDLSQYIFQYGKFDVPLEYAEHIEASRTILFEGGHFQKIYLWKIGTLPNVRCQTNIDHDCLVFKYDGGGGVLMRVLSEQEAEDRKCATT